jgi:hypothetical protein
MTPLQRNPKDCNCVAKPRAGVTQYTGKRNSSTADGVMGSGEIHRFRLGETMKLSVGPAAMISPAGLTNAKTPWGESP